MRKTLWSDTQNKSVLWMLTAIEGKNWGCATRSSRLSPDIWNCRVRISHCDKSGEDLAGCCCPDFLDKAHAFFCLFCLQIPTRKQYLFLWRPDSLHTQADDSSRHERVYGLGFLKFPLVHISSEFLPSPKSMPSVSWWWMQIFKLSKLSRKSVSKVIYNVSDLHTRRVSRSLIVFELFLLARHLIKGQKVDPFLVDCKE